MYAKSEYFCKPNSKLLTLPDLYEENSSFPRNYCDSINTANILWLIRTMCCLWRIQALPGREQITHLGSGIFALNRFTTAMPCHW